MEYNGIKVDVARLLELSRGYGQRLEALEQEIHQLAGRPFNIASPKQLQELLFTELKLPVMKKTAKTGPSTDAEVLEELARVHPLPAKILEYRQYAKLKSTYVDALPAMVCPETGRVHASFHQAVAATGRLSSSDPNLQNIPVRTQAGREIRSAFVPGQEGWVLMAADYSQIELRVLAHFSGDTELFEAFARDEDIHARVAGQVNGVPLEMVTPEMRRAAKAVNFGVIYGQSPFGLARGLGIDHDQAAKFIDSYFEGYPGIEKFLAQVLAKCRENGYVTTILGRRRAISGVREGAGRQRNLAERHRGQHGDPGVGGGSYQIGDGCDPPPVVEGTPAGKDVTANPRRVDLRSSLRSAPPIGRACHGRNGRRLRVERSLESRYQSRSKLGRNGGNA